VSTADSGENDWADGAHVGELARALAHVTARLNDPGLQTVPELPTAAWTLAAKCDNEPHLIRRELTVLLEHVIAELDRWNSFHCSSPLMMILQVELEHALDGYPPPDWDDDDSVALCRALACLEAARLVPSGAALGKAANLLAEALEQSSAPDVRRLYTELVVHELIEVRDSAPALVNVLLGLFVPR